MSNVIKAINKVKLTGVLAMTVVWISPAHSQTAVYLDEKQPIEKRIANALSLMTIEEKVQLLYGQSMFSGKGVPRLGIPELTMIDGPAGVHAEVAWSSFESANWTNDFATGFPATTALAATFNPKISLLYGKAIGAEARFRNKSVLLGPSANIYRTPLNGRNFENMGEDPYLVSKMVVPYILGVQQNGVAACVKAYAMYNQGQDSFDLNVNVSDRAMREIYLPAFKAAVTEGKAWSLMTSYNKVRGQYAGQNALLINQILKKEWHFDGAVISDWNGIHNTAEAVNNGLDIEMGTGNGLKSFDLSYMANPYLAGLKSGTYSEAGLNDKAARVLRLTFRTSMNTQKPWGSFATEAHAEVARQVAEEGIVLLKNSGNLLPLNLANVKKIAVIGENATLKLAHLGGSSSVKVKYEITPLEGLKKAVGDKATITYAMGYSAGPYSFKEILPSKYDEDTLIKEAVEKAANADVVLYFGGLNKHNSSDTEGSDRKSYGMPYNQDKLLAALLKVNKNLVVNLISGNAIGMPWVDQVPTIVQSWHLGSEAGNAIANVILGKVNPSGKLPFTFPVKLTDNGAHAFGEIGYPGINKNVEYKDDILVGYRWHDTKKILPLFAFGHGLSYTTFQYGTATTDKKLYSKNDIVKLSFNLKNTGKVKGAEATQVYITQVKASVMRPAKELKGFAKVMLEPGQGKKIDIDLPVKDWAFFNDKTQQWEVEPGQFVIQIGASSADVKEKVLVSIQ
jgi:beta-glucosidase